jgi:hypothetical protein
MMLASAAVPAEIRAAPSRETVMLASAAILAEIRPRYAGRP